jgi:outer membrane biosynthesis protein TonB
MTHIIIHYINMLKLKTDEIPSAGGGFRKKNNLKPTVIQSKEILGKIRRIYKVAGSRKEQIKYKGELISVSDYKNLVKQAKALKSQNKPVTKPKAKPTAKPAPKPKAKPTAKPATKPKAKPSAKSATKPKAKPASKSTTKTTIKSATKSKAK